MPIDVPITQQSYRELSRLLRSTGEITCLTHGAYVRAVLVATQMLLEGKIVNAKVVKGYPDEQAT